MNTAAISFLSFSAMVKSLIEHELVPALETPVKPDAKTTEQVHKARLQQMDKLQDFFSMIHEHDSATHVES